MVRAEEEEDGGALGDIAGGRAQVDDARRGGGDLAERVDVRHDVVPPLLLFRGGDLELLCVQVLSQDELCQDICARAGGTYEVRLHLLDGLIRDREAELLLSDGEVEPELPPRVEAVLYIHPLSLPWHRRSRRGGTYGRGKEMGHLFACIAAKAASGLGSERCNNAEKKGQLSTLRAASGRCRRTPCWPEAAVATRRKSREEFGVADQRNLKLLERRDLADSYVTHISDLLAQYGNQLVQRSPTERFALYKKYLYTSLYVSSSTESSSLSYIHKT